MKVMAITNFGPGIKVHMSEEPRKNLIHNTNDMVTHLRFKGFWGFGFIFGHLQFLRADFGEFSEFTEYIMAFKLCSTEEHPFQIAVWIYV